MFNEGLIASLVPFAMAACLLVFLVIRTIRKAGSRKYRNPHRQVKDAKKAFDKAEPNPNFPLLDSSPELRRWQAEMYDIQREVSAQIDTKLALLNATIRAADRKIQELSELEKRLEGKSDQKDRKENAA